MTETYRLWDLWSHEDYPHMDAAWHAVWWVPRYATPNHELRFALVRMDGQSPIQCFIYDDLDDATNGRTTWIANYDGEIAIVPPQGVDITLTDHSHIHIHRARTDGGALWTVYEAKPIPS